MKKKNFMPFFNMQLRNLFMEYLKFFEQVIQV